MAQSRSLKAVPRLSDVVGLSAAIIVFTPSYESLWFASLAKRFPNTNFTCIACSIPEKEPERAYHFFDACEHLHMFGRLIPVPESIFVDGLRFLDLMRYDTLVILGRNVNRETDIIFNRVLSTADQSQKIIVGGKMPTHQLSQTIVLDPSELEMKSRALHSYSSLNIDAVAAFEHFYIHGG